MSISEDPGTTNDVDPIDRDAARIDARSDDAREQIAELVEHADEVGRDVEDSPIRPSGDTPETTTYADARSSSGDGQSSTVYVTAHGPGAIDTEAVSNLLAESDLGGAVKSHAYGSDFVTLVVEVDGVVDEAAYDLVIGKTGVALGPHWTVVATVDASEG